MQERCKENLSIGAFESEFLAEHLRQYRDNKYDEDNFNHYDKNRDVQNEFSIESELRTAHAVHHRALAPSGAAHKFFKAAGFEKCAMQLATISNPDGDLDAEVSTPHAHR